MNSKNMIRIFCGKPVRSVWDDGNKEWRFSASDVVYALSETTDPRRYWNNLKSRHAGLSSVAVRMQLFSGDGKRYLADVISQTGIDELGRYISIKQRETLKVWVKESSFSADEISKRRAYDLFDSN